MLKSTIQTTFKLSDKFMEQFRGKQPAWGFNNLSYFTYKRTYARIMEDGKQEEFADTLERVVNGTYRAQEKHCKTQGLHWNANKAQYSAQEMFQRMWDFKFLPPGRGLWMMGTDHVDKVGSAALNNCLSGDTEIITRSGIKIISDLVGQEPELLVKGGKWVKAPIKSFGHQRLFEITLSRAGISKTIFATSDHRWFASDRRKQYRDSKFSEFKTTELRPGIHRLQSVFGTSPSGLVVSPFGVAHGFTFGDGTTTGQNFTGRVNLCGKKDLAVEKYFSNCNRQERPDLGPEGVIEFSGLPNYFRKLPSINENSSYLYSWLMGYFAADGTVKADGTVQIASYEKESLLFVRDVCAKLGIGIWSLRSEERVSNLTNRPAICWYLNFMKAQLTQDFFLNTDHKKNFSSDKTIHHWLVKSVKESDRFEEVFCATVDGYRNFALAENILTGNCGFTSTEDINVDFGTPFAWTMDMLMLGVGIGFDTKGAGKVKIKMPIHSPIDLDPEHDPSCFIIPDSREGWVESLRLLLNSYINGRYVYFSYKEIRPAGLPIKGFGGISSGPDPLRECHEAIVSLLNNLSGKEITSVAIVDIMNFIGKCVVSGNVRRSAELAIGDINDDSYIEMKDYRLYPEELSDRRWASNNSVFVDKFTDFNKVGKNILLNGEPGLIFLDNARHYGRIKDGFIPEDDRRYDHVMGFNPCAEQQLESKELCCLVETFPSKHDSIEDYHRTLKFAYLYAKTVTLIPTHDERTNAVIMRNRRIGTSQSGIQQAITKFGRQNYLHNLCDTGYSVIKKWDRIYSRWFGVPESIRLSTVKPSGTVSLLAGVWPGVHFTHSEAYMRTVRLSAVSQYVGVLLDAGFKIEFNSNEWTKVREAYEDCFSETISNIQAQEMCKVSLTKEDENLITWFGLKGGTLVVYFPVVEENFDKSKFDVTLWEQMSTVREMQYFWADNSVSCTITVKDTEHSDLVPAIEYIAPYVKTLSFLPLTNHQYSQAPYIEKSKEEVLSYANSLKFLDLSNIRNQSIAGSKFCDSESCSI